MDCERCIICGARADLSDVLRALLELKCEHMICPQCILKEDKNILNKKQIRCLHCEQESRLSPEKKRILYEAQQKMETGTQLVCAVHSNEKVLYVDHQCG